MRVVPSICTFCGVGCGLGLRVEDGRVIGVEPQPGHPVSQGQLGVISCARASNEDNYAAQKFTRAVLKTHNIDHCARTCHSPSVAGLARTPATLAMPYHFHEAPCNRLTNDAQDPISKMPELKACAVKVEPLPPGQAPSAQAGSREVRHASL